MRGTLQDWPGKSHDLAHQCGFFTQACCQYYHLRGGCLRGSLRNLVLVPISNARANARLCVRFYYGIKDDFTVES